MTFSAPLRQFLHGGALHGLGGPRARRDVSAPTFRANKWPFANCKSYIDAQDGRNEPDDSLQGELPKACRSLAAGHTPPTHL